MNDDLNFENVYKELYPVALNYARSRTASEDEAKDIVSEVFVRLFSNYDTYRFDNTSFVKVWLYRTVDLVHSELQRKSPLIESLEDYENILEGDDNLNACTESEQYQHYISKIEKKLDGMDQLLFRKVFIEKKRYKQIQDELQIKSTTLRSAISRLRKKLKPYVNELLNL